MTARVIELAERLRDCAEYARKLVTVRADPDLSRFCALADEAASLLERQIPDPRDALLTEVAGTWTAFEHALREAIGNTNYNVIAERIEAAIGDKEESKNGSPSA